MQFIKYTKPLLAVALATMLAPAYATFEYHVPIRGLALNSEAPPLAPPATDPSFAKVAGLFNFDGNVTSTPPLTVSATGVAYAPGKFGQALDLRANAASGNPRVAGLALTLPAINTQDFTVEGWLNTKTLSAAGTDTLITGTNYDKLLFRPSNRGDALYVAGASCGAFPLNTWTPYDTWMHFAIVRASGQVTVYKNGVPVKTCANASGSMPAGTWKLGSRESNSEAYSGLIDDFRVTIGQARYTGAFTPPLQAYPAQ